MPLSHRRLGTDEELGKRDDDHHLHHPLHHHSHKTKSRTAPFLPLWRSSTGFHRRRLLAYTLLFVVILLLLRIASKSDAATALDRYSSAGRGQPFSFRDILPAAVSHAGGGGSSKSALSPLSPTAPPPHDEKDEDEESKRARRHYYNGPINYHTLGMSLNSVAARTLGYRTTNRNVLFVAGSLKTAALLIPLACEMARWRRCDVHFALMSRDDLALPDILRVNGVDGGGCGVNWHDARPDYASYSSNARVRQNSDYSLGLIYNFVHPQVLLMITPEAEEGVFAKAVPNRAQELNIPIIGLPTNALESMLWMARLDSSSLRSWNKMDVEIVVHAQVGATGGLVRLLKSLEAADYMSSCPPRLTLELPPVIDPAARLYLQGFNWPQRSASASASPQNAGRLSVRHRVGAPRDAAVAPIESFFPATASDSHVLVLSPQAELSPHFFHFVKYAVLEYRYSAYGGAPARERVAGISLELPTHQPAAHYTTPTTMTSRAPATPPSLFIPPAERSAADFKNDNGAAAHVRHNASLFLWQAPNSNAAVYFGDRWAELHSLVRRRLKAERAAPALADTTKNAGAGAGAAAAVAATADAPQQSSGRRQPSRWTEHMLDLFRLRGYLMAYPQLGPDNVIVAVHMQPDAAAVYSFTSTSTPTANKKNKLNDGESSGGGGGGSRGESRISPHISSLLTLLPAGSGGDLPEVEEMPVLAFDGAPTTLARTHAAAATFADEYRLRVGGCSSSSSLSSSSSSLPSAIPKTGASAAAGPAARPFPFRRLKLSELFCLPSPEGSGAANDNEDDEVEEETEAQAAEEQEGQDDGGSGGDPGLDGSSDIGSSGSSGADGNTFDGNGNGDGDNINENSK